MSSTDEIKNIVETVGRNTDELWRKYRQRLSENVSRVWLLGEAESRELKHVFVELSIEEYRRPSDRNQWMGFVDAELRKRRSLFWDSLDFSEEKEKNTIQSDDLLRDGTRAVITGAPGCGKSTLLRWLVGKALNDASPCLPVYLELKSINEELFKACQGKLIELLFELAIAQPLHFVRQSEYEYLKAEFMERLAQRQVAIFLDGLDEVRNTVFFEELCRSIDSFIGSDYGRNLLIVSTRPYALDVLFQDTKEMEIQPLNQDQIAAFLHHYYDGDPMLNVNALVQKLQRRELSDLIRAPILLGALVKRYREKGETELTGDRLKLYEDLTHDLAVTVDREKNVKRYSFSDKESRRNVEFLEQIAFKRLFDERIESDAQRLTFEGDWILNEAKGFCSQGSIDAYDFAADVKASPLLREVAEDVWAFSPLTIQEYLAARALTVRPDGEVVFCRAYFNPTLVEMEALPMALGLSKEPDKLYRVIEQLPESLNFAGLRLRARGLAYGAGISHSLFEQLVDRLIEFVGNAYIEETGYSYSIVRSYKGVGNMRSDFIGERVRQLLKSEDGQVRISAAEALGEIGAEQAVAGLIEALKDLDVQARWSAANALGEIGGEQAVAGLIEALMDLDNDLYGITASALGKIGGEQAVAVLIEALKDQDSYVRWRAAIALGEIGAEQAVAVLIEALKDQDSLLHRRAAYALGEIGGEQAVAGLIEALKDLDSPARSDVVEALGKIGGEQTVAVLIEALKDLDRYVRWHASIELIKIGGEQAVAALIEALKDRDRGVRIMAAEALGGIGAEQAVVGLIEALKDQDRDVRESAAEALGEIGGEQAVAVLIEALKDLDSYVRSSAAKALGKIGAEQAVAVLIEALKDQDSRVRERAAEALGEIGGEQAVAVLIEALKDQDSSVRESAASALGKIGGEQAVAVLIEALKDQDSSVRESAAEALGEIGAEQAVAVLIEALKDQDDRVPRRAAEALGKIGGEQAVAGLIEALKRQDMEVRWRAASALGEIGAEQAVAVLIEALKDLDRHVRWTAAEALELIKIESLTKGLQDAMSHQNGFVRRKAAKVIGYYSVVVAEKELNRLAENDPDLEVKQVAENALTQLELKKRYFGHSADGDS